MLRSVVRVAAADRRRAECGGAGLCRCRHARGIGADGRRPQLFRGDPGPYGGIAAGIAGARRRTAAAARRGDDRRDARGTRRLVLRPRAAMPGGGADDPASLLGRVHHWLRRSGARIRRAVAQPRRRVEGPGGDRHPGLRHDPDGTPRRARRARAAFHRRARGVARRRRHAPARRPRRLGRAQPRQQHAARRRARRHEGNAGAPGQSRDRHRWRQLLRQPEHVRGDAAGLARLEGAGARLAAVADDARGGIGRDRGQRPRPRLCRPDRPDRRPATRRTSSCSTSTTRTGCR